jgi:hypothetical protein
LQIFVLALAALIASCGSDARVGLPFEFRPPHYLDEYYDPLAPARLHDNTFEMQSSWDPGALDLRDINYPSNIDFGVFLRDCRRESQSNPIHFLEREPGFCPKDIDGLVMAHAQGPGVLARFWMTALDPLTEKQWGDERLAVYVDGARRFSTALAQLADGVWPESWWGEQLSGCLLSYVPIAFDSDIWIVLEGAHAKMYYYQADLVRGEQPAPHPYPTLQPVREVAVEPGTAVLYRASGAGAATQLSFMVRQADAPGLADARLQFAFDGVTSSVRVGDLCNASYILAKFHTNRINVTTGDGRIGCELNWGWPHAREGTITISSRVSLRTWVTAAKLDSAPPGRFFAYTVTHESADSELEWANVQGMGRLVAVILDGEAEPDPNFLTPDALNWLESDEILYVDGKMAAHGTGTEDFFNGGFYFNEGAFARIFGGVSFVGKTASGWGRAQMARYFLGADQINFQKSFRATWEVAPLKHRMRLTPIFYVAP